MRYYLTRSDNQHASHVRLRPTAVKLREKAPQYEWNFELHKVCNNLNGSDRALYFLIGIISHVCLDFLGFCSCRVCVLRRVCAVS
jgi:hypothetical protein